MLLRARQFDGRERSLVDLVLVVVIKPLRGCQRLLLYAYIFSQRDQVVIEPRDAIDGFQYLFLKQEPGRVLIKLGWDAGLRTREIRRL